MGIHEIEEAIKQLTPDELASFREWYEEFDAQLWDTQIEADAKSGKLAKLSEKAAQEYGNGQAKEL
jgi:hypothetical protein